MSFSILGKIRESEEERPEFYDDLNLTQWIEEINGQLGIYDLREYFRQMPDGREQIRFRQEVLQEIDEEMEIKLTEFVNRIRQAQENEAYINSETGEQITDELSKAHWKLEVAVMYFTAVDELIAFLEERECRARGWQQFLEMCKEESGKPEVRAYHDAALSTSEELEKIRYSLRIEGDHVAILPSVVEDDYVKELCEKYPQMIKHPGKMGNLLPGGKAGTPLEQRIFKYLQKKFSQQFKRLEEFGKQEARIYQPGIMQFHKEICVYLSILKFQHHMEYFHYDFCMPEFSDAAFEVTGGYDLALALKNQKEGKETVANDYYYRGKERFFVITGPNQGGKTTFARAAGQLVYFSLMGFPVPAKRAAWMARAASTRHFTSAELSGVSFRRMDAYSTAGTLTWRSIRSSRGPEIFSTYFSTSRSEQVHRPEGCPRQPHRQGFMAHTSWNRAGRCSVPPERATVTSPSSRGWRMASSTSR